MINITGSDDMTLHEIQIIVNHVRGEAAENANIIFGTVFDESKSGSLKVSVLATGIPDDSSYEFHPKSAFAPNPISSKNQPNSRPYGHMNSPVYNNYYNESRIQEKQEVDALEIPAYIRRGKRSEEE